LETEIFLDTRIDHFHIHFYFSLQATAQVFYTYSLFNGKLTAMARKRSLDDLLLGSSSSTTLPPSLPSLVHLKSTAPISEFWTADVDAIAHQLWQPCELADAHERITNRTWFRPRVCRNKTGTLPASTTVLVQHIAAAVAEEHQRLLPDVVPPTVKRARKKKDGTVSAVKPAAERACKYRLFPTKKQRRLIRTWIGAARWVYNHSLDEVKREHITTSMKKQLRPKVIYAKAFEDDSKHTWLLDIPYNIRDEALADLCKAYKSNEAKKKKKPTLTFAIHHRHRKDPSQTFVIPSREYNRVHGVYQRLFGHGKHAMRSAEPLPKTIDHDARVQWVPRLDQYYLIVPVQRPALPTTAISDGVDVGQSDNQGLAFHLPPFDSIAVIDPGVRTFATVYDPLRRRVVEWGKYAMRRIMEQCVVIDHIRSKIAKANHRQRRNLGKAEARKQQKIQNLVTELQRKFARWLCENYRVVLLPKFETQSMVTKWLPGRGYRRLSTQTARQMCTWAHWRFRQRLVDKALDFPFRSIVLCDERWTSKTCSRCGHLQLGLTLSDRVFSCPNCLAVIDRDANASFNILLRYLAVHNLANALIK
jgi:putative transposase